MNMEVLIQYMSYILTGIGVLAFFSQCDCTDD